MDDFIQLTADDGFQLDAYRVKGSDAAKGGLVLIQEIFGVNDHIQKTCDRFARHGYEVIAPAIFDRQEKNINLGYTEEGTAKGRALKQNMDWDNLILDVKAAAQKLLETNERVNIIGYCLGGTVAWVSACRIEGFSKAVGYYGGQINEFLNEKPHCPTMLHFGELDPLIPVSDIDKIEAAYPETTIYRYPAGHGFDCNQRADYHGQSAAFALEKTVDFLANRF